MKEDILEAIYSMPCLPPSSLSCKKKDDWWWKDDPIPDEKAGRRQLEIHQVVQLESSLRTLGRRVLQSVSDMADSIVISLNTCVLLSVT